MKSSLIISALAAGVLAQQSSKIAPPLHSFPRIPATDLPSESLPSTLATATSEAPSAASSSGSGTATSKATSTSTGLAVPTGQVHIAPVIGLAAALLVL